MRQLIRQFLPWLLLLSLAGNLWLAKAVWDRDKAANLYTWGNLTSSLSQYIHWAHMEGPTETHGLSLAIETLDHFQSLPHGPKRTDHQEMQVIRQFLAYAQRSAYRAQQEMAEGGLSRESEQRWEQIEPGLQQLGRTLGRQNQLKMSSHPWNHNGWREMWKDAAQDLQSLELVPLD